MTNLPVGYGLMLEQFTPLEGVELSVYAEQHGFTGVSASDHAQPWVSAQGQASFSWNVLTAIAERTTGDFGPAVIAPGLRWHPFMIAHAAATAAAMYPGRAWLGLGTGEALNEHVVGGYWPEVGARSRRMWEAVEIINGLFSGKKMKYSGEFFTLETTKLWTMPEVPPQIHIATAGPLNAEKTGRFADGIITVGASKEKIRMLLDRFAKGAREAGKDPATMPKILQLHLSWATTQEEAERNALTEWPNGGMSFPKADIRSPEDFDEMAKLVRLEDFANRMVISSNPQDHLEAIQGFVDCGFDKVYLHNVGRNQREWIEVFGSEVLPKLRLPA